MLGRAVGVIGTSGATGFDPNPRLPWWCRAHPDRHSDPTVPARVLRGAADAGFARVDNAPLAGSLRFAPLSVQPFRKT